MNKTLLYTLLYSILLICPTNLLYAQHEGTTFYAAAENLRRKGQYDSALKQFKEAITREPTNPRYFFGQAQCEFILKKNSEALKSLYELIKISKTYAPAYALMAKIYLAKNDVTKATQLYEMAFRYEKNPKKKMSYKMFVIKEHIKNKKYEAALHKIAEAKIVDAKNVELRYYDAQISNILGKYQSAKASILSIEDAIRNRHYSENSRFYYELGYALYHLKEYKEAFVAWEKAYYGPYKVKIEVFSPGFFNKLALAYFAIYDFETATEYITLISKIDENHLESQALALKIKKEKAIDYEVLSFQEKAAEQADESGKKSNYYKEICKAYLATNQLPKALEAVTKALEAKSKDIETLFLQAVIHYKQKKFINVVETLDLIISHTQDEKSLSKFHFLKGLSQLELKEQEGAKKTLMMIKTQPYKSVVIQKMQKSAKK
jgi:tetratricopeptide (TPR) repeat protein